MSSDSSTGTWPSNVPSSWWGYRPRYSSISALLAHFGLLFWIPTCTAWTHSAGESRTTKKSFLHQLTLDIGMKTAFQHWLVALDTSRREKAHLQWSFCIHCLFMTFPFFSFSESLWALSLAVSGLMNVHIFIKYLSSMLEYRSPAERVYFLCIWNWQFWSCILEQSANVL